jgi:hypothetical protein
LPYAIRCGRIPGTQVTTRARRRTLERGPPAASGTLVLRNSARPAKPTLAQSSNRVAPARLEGSEFGILCALRQEDGIAVVSGPAGARRILWQVEAPPAAARAGDAC